MSDLLLLFVCLILSLCFNFLLVYLLLHICQTYNTDKQTADSSGAATAMFAGVKTKYSTLGVDDRVEFDVCETTKEATIDSVLVSAREIGALQIKLLFHTLVFFSMFRLLVPSLQ